jgi:hypothetical protein
MADSAKHSGDRTIFRVANRHKPYAQLGNGMLRDSRLSFEARGVLAFILSFPSNWHFGLAWLCRDQGIGRDKARRIGARDGRLLPNRAERALAQAASVGATAEPSEAVLRGVTRRARARGDDPDAVIAAWRASVRGLPVRDADRSLLAFADQRALSRRAVSVEGCERFSGNTGQPRTT